MKIQLRSLAISNFKGIKSFNLSLNGDATSIYGDNKTGKSTLFDAFWWCLFGKDSSGAAQFSVKPIWTTRTILSYGANANKVTIGQTIPKLQNEVEAVLMVDGRKVVFKRVQKEKWVTRRGETEPVFSGHETIYFVDDISIPMRDYNDRVDDLISEDLFKLITSNTHFNSLRWDERRKILFSLVDNVSYEDVAGQEKEFQDLLDELSGKDIEQYKIEIRQKIKRAKDASKDIPSRIDEVNRGIPEAVDEKKINKEINSLQAEVDEIDKQIESIVERNRKEESALSEKQSEMFTLERELKEYRNSIENDQKSKLREHEQLIHDAENNFSSARRAVTNKKEYISNVEKDIDEIEVAVQSKREEWELENARTFGISADELVCQSCGQNLPEDKSEAKTREMLKQFNEHKTNNLNRIRESGHRHAERLKKLKAELVEDKERLKELEAKATEAENHFLQVSKTEATVVGISEQQQAHMDDLLSKIEAIEAMLKNRPEQEGIQPLKDKRAGLVSEITVLNTSLQVNKQIEKSRLRITELEEEHKKYAQQIADLEKIEFVIQNFTKARIDMIEERINSLFSHVQFRMFDEQINEGIKETCVTLVDGVPYPDANSEGKINAGLDIINVLGKHHGVTAPCFIDNRESVVKLIDTDSQIINLFVSEQDKEISVF